jgi:hypothetical protein
MPGLGPITPSLLVSSRTGISLNIHILLCHQKWCKSSFKELEGELHGVFMLACLSGDSVSGSKLLFSSTEAFQGLCPVERTVGSRLVSVPADKSS